VRDGRRRRQRRRQRHARPPGTALGGTGAWSRPGTDGAGYPLDAAITRRRRSDWGTGQWVSGPL